jgi:hypothetical protein
MTLQPQSEIERAIGLCLYRRDVHTPEPKSWVWGRDYGRDLLADINQLAHAGTDALTRDCLQRAYAEILRLRHAHGEGVVQK